MYAYAQWYSHYPRSGAIYLGNFSFHWCIDRALPWEPDRHPRRAIFVFKPIETAFKLLLWKHRDFCPHGYYKPSGAIRLCETCKQACALSAEDSATRNGSVI